MLSRWRNPRKRAFALILVSVILLTLTACGEKPENNAPQVKSASDAGSSANTASETNVPANPKNILITYFSRTGNTKTVAGHVQTLTGGELFEIKTAEAYPDDYNACLAQASEELAADYRPELSTHISKMDDFDIIFVGYPIWHGDTPMAIRSFLEEYDISGKTVIPFCTSGGSGIGQSMAAVRNLCPASDVLNGLCISSSNLGSAYELVEEWIAGLDIKTVGGADESELNDNEENSMTNITITVGGSVFSAKLYDNSTANALLAQFPMTLNMSDLNGNEKYYYLTDKLPSESAERPETINAGDIMCWSDNCLVLFYKTFSNSYGGYIRLGYVEDVSGLAAALGSGGVQITFALSVNSSNSFK